MSFLSSDTAPPDVVLSVLQHHFRFIRFEFRQANDISNFVFCILMSAFIAFNAAVAVRYLTKAYPLEALVSRSVITVQSTNVPNGSKTCRKSSLVAENGTFRTNRFLQSSLLLTRLTTA